MFMLVITNINLLRLEKGLNCMYVNLNTNDTSKQKTIIKEQMYYKVSLSKIVHV